jgi:integrase
VAQRLEIGEVGEIALTPQRQGSDGKWRKAAHAQSATRWRAHARYRHWDGTIRDVNGFGRTRKLATAACEAQARDRLRVPSAEIRPSSPLKEACRTYLDWLARPGSKTSPRTVSDYERAYKNVINNEGTLIGNLKLSEANDTQRLRRFLQHVADSRGTGTATRVKSILSGTMWFAVNSGVLDENRVRHVGAVAATNAYSSPRDHARAMTRAERDHVVELAFQLAVDPLGDPRSRRKRLATAHQVAFLAGTGVRIDESRLVTWPDLTDNLATVAIRGTKTVHSNRVLSLPTWLTDLLVTRLHEESTMPAYDFDPAGYVFAAPGPLHNRTKWESANNSSAIRALLDRAGLDWAIPHTFRRTVATLLDQEGVPLPRIADQLGHSDPAMTMQKYLGRDLRGNKADLAIHL